MSLATGAPTAFTIHRVEKKRDLPAKDGLAPKVILKLGLEDSAGEKGWAEIFNDAPEATWPKVGSVETLILKQPDNPNYALTAMRPGRGGGGGRGKSGASDGSIEAQVAFKGAIELAVAGRVELDGVAGLTDEFAQAIRDAK